MGKAKKDQASKKNPAAAGEEGRQSPPKEELSFAAKVSICLTTPEMNVSPVAVN